MINAKGNDAQANHDAGIGKKKIAVLATARIDRIALVKTWIMQVSRDRLWRVKLSM